jgi:diacylglycerol O-acyltransferase
MPAGSVGLAPRSGELALAKREVPLPLLQRLGERVELARPLVQLGLTLLRLPVRPLLSQAAAPAVNALSLSADGLGELLFAGRHLRDTPSQRLLELLELARPLLLPALCLARVAPQGRLQLLDRILFLPLALPPALHLAPLRFVHGSPVGALALARRPLLRALWFEESHGLDDRTSAMLQRLTPEDARILALESGAIVGHTCKVMIADGAGDTVERLQEQITQRIGLVPSCRQRIAPTPFHLAAPAWVDDPEFDVRHHVRAFPSDGVIDRVRLREIVATLMSERLQRDRPLWAIDAVGPLEDGRVALVWRIHHAMADGQATLGIGSMLLWSESPDEQGAAAPAPPAEPLPGPTSLLAAAATDHAQTLAGAALRAGRGLLSGKRWRESMAEIARAPSTIARELRPTHAASPFDARIGRRRRVAFIDRELDEVHRTAKACGAAVTVNDLVLSVVAGGLRRWLEARHGTIGPLRVQVPVSMHHSDEEPGAIPNRDSFINVELPVQEDDPVRRLLAVKEQTSVRKTAHDAEELYALFADVSHVSKSLFRLTHRLASNPHVFALSISNVRGPAGELYLAGGRIREFYSLAEIAPHHALRVSAGSFGGRMAIGLCADADAVPDLSLLAEGIEHSLEELTVPAK